MSRPDSDAAPSRLPLGVGLLVAGLAAIALGLVLPQVLGSFSDRQSLLLALAQGACLALITVGVVVMAWRLRTSHEALWALARRDELTGVGNYRSLHERLAEEISRHGRHGRQFALILLDLDGFKQVNELHGHLAGDRLPQGGRDSSACRGEGRYDSVFRQGGDEFAVIVEETDTEEAGEVAARIRDRVSARGQGSDTELPLSARAPALRSSPATGTGPRRCWAAPTSTCSPPSGQARAPHLPGARSRRRRRRGS